MSRMMDKIRMRMAANTTNTSVEIWLPRQPMPSTIVSLYEAMLLRLSCHWKMYSVEPKLWIKAKQQSYPGLEANS